MEGNTTKVADDRCGGDTVGVVDIYEDLMCIVIIINITQCINGWLSLLTFFRLKIREADEDDHWKEGFFSLIAALLSSPRLHMLWLSPFLWLSIISIDNVIIL